MVSYDRTTDSKCEWMPNGSTATPTLSVSYVVPLDVLVTNQNAKEIAERKAIVYIL